MKTTPKRLLLLERARLAEAAAADLQDPEAIEAAGVLHLRAAELVADLLDLDLLDFEQLDDDEALEAAL